MSGFSDENEPSMEDILASIRKIISEDADPVPLDVPSAPTFSPDSLSTASEAATAETLSFSGEAEAPRLDRPSLSQETVASAQAIGDGPLQSTSPNMVSETGDFDIDALLKDIDLIEPETLPTGQGDALSGFDADDTIALEIPEIPDDVNVSIDSDAGSATGVRMDEPSASGVTDNGLGDEMDEPDDVFFDRILGLYDEETESDAKQPHAAGVPAEQSHPLNDLDPGNPSRTVPKRADKTDRPSFDDGDDLDLVKSLMADLTDGDDDAQDEPPQQDAMSSEDDDILDDILNMAMDDEVALGPPLDADPLAQIAEIAEADDETEIDLAETTIEEPVELQVDEAAIEADLDDLLISSEAHETAVTDELEVFETSIPSTLTETRPSEDASLMAIAAAAEADAQAAQSRLSSLTRRAESEAGQADAERGDEDPDVKLDMTDTDERPAHVKPPIAPEAKTPDSAQPAPVTPAEPTTPIAPAAATPELPQKETPMPTAVRHDVILDDVTEEASMSAFAELNNLVEEKTILEERGPRIGDLVQEALKPMLKEWLEDNLHAIVERAVAKEVKRIASGK